MPELANPGLIKNLGTAAVVLFAIVMILQLLLAAGVLPVSLAWGGRQSQLTPSLRLSSLAAVLILAGFAYVIARRSGILGSAPPSTLIRIMSWLITLYLALNTGMNFLSPSRGERWVFGPITLALVVLCSLISIYRSALAES